VTFSVSGSEPNQLALFLNGVVVLWFHLLLRSRQVIVQLSAADVLTVVNHSSSSSITLSDAIGGTQSVARASLLVQVGAKKRWGDSTHCN
jgi:hypothetical protein